MFYIYNNFLGFLSGKVSLMILMILKILEYKFLSGFVWCDVYNQLKNGLFAS